MTRRVHLLALLLLLFLAATAAGQEEVIHADDDEDNHGDENDTHDEEIEREREVREKANHMKVMAMCVLGGLGIIVNGVTVACPGLRTHKFAMSIISSFGAGVFLVVGLGHLLSDATDIFQKYYAAEVVERYRPGAMMAILGYAFTLVLQRGIFTVDEHSIMDDDDDDDAGAPDTATDTTTPADSPVGPSAAEPIEPVVSTAAKASPGVEQMAAVPVVGLPTADAGVSDEAVARKNRAALLNLVVFFISFYIHGVMEGVALGLQRTREAVLLVFLAIVSHHWAADFLFAFATGKVAELRDKPLGRFAVACLLSFNTVIGIGIGWGIGASSRVAPVTTGYIVAFCAGTFLMIALTEMVAEEMPLGKRSGWQLLAFFIGVGVMYAALSSLYSPEAHAH